MQPTASAAAGVAAATAAAADEELVPEYYVEATKAALPRQVLV
jgi:hypothetical protein